jgi:hypothetical protein
VGIVAGENGELTMKKTEENLEKYRAHVKARGYDKLTPMVNQPSDLNKLMVALAKEGEALLNQVPPAKPSSPKVLEQALGKISTNPYIRARAQVLKDLAADRRETILKLEAAGKIEDSRYKEFVKMVRILGDRFSDRT